MRLPAALTSQLDDDALRALRSFKSPAAGSPGSSPALLVRDRTEAVAPSEGDAISKLGSIAVALAALVLVGCGQSKSDPPPVRPVATLDPSSREVVLLRQDLKTAAITLSDTFRYEDGPASEKLRNYLGVSAGVATAVGNKSTWCVQVATLDGQQAVHLVGHGDKFGAALDGPC